MRAPMLDSLRGLAVVWMVIFHTSYDMRMFNLVSWSFEDGFWFAFPRIIAFTFLYCVGASLNFTHRPNINWNALGKRSLKLGACALIVSLSTYFIFPTQWIYFGTLHCIFVGSILGALVVNTRKVALTLMLAILTGQYILSYDIKWLSSIIQKHSMDFIPIYPWFWAILLGILTGPRLTTVGQTWAQSRPLHWLGKNSLMIYLLHQPIIYGLIWFISSVV
ncbi:MAG TPA: heparan-alpha-glucosaminide N-acetyltransferase [Bacteriovoracaceae bacterium]|nr:heparan-alpha-glucosaminide N-acetyltransferase [Bacteriovoracaceae bacterium]